MNKNDINSDEKFLKIFKHKVTGSAQGAFAYRKEHLLFKEHICLLEKTEQFIREVREGIWDESQLDELFSQPRNLNKIAEICESLDAFRFPKKLCDNPIILKNINFQRLLKIYRSLDCDLSIQIANNFRNQNSISESG